eukprot:CAMPEP_0184653112 /NCGR_PEP_ID=MMETSP0308-20130426/10854_1 /TAXON_ID=38269 /ORGANISM="Gloeochaete witrockiana, Strain SAG 46.84" /LENGTH=439 /DNA_ID=CAMNT_0027088415 /DNA_START=182 /DNA_END=1501 /DNA_ORIENTATION=-
MDSKKVTSMIEQPDTEAQSFPETSGAIAPTHAAEFQLPLSTDQENDKPWVGPPEKGEDWCGTVTTTPFPKDVVVLGNAVEIFLKPIWQSAEHSKDVIASEIKPWATDASVVVDAYLHRGVEQLDVTADQAITGLLAFEKYLNEMINKAQLPEMDSRFAQPSIAPLTIEEEAQRIIKTNDVDSSGAADESEARGFLPDSVIIQVDDFPPSGEGFISVEAEGAPASQGAVLVSEEEEEEVSSAETEAQDAPASTAWFTVSLSTEDGSASSQTGGAIVLPQDQAESLTKEVLVMDGNADGILSRKELFFAMDADHNGSITTEELIAIANSHVDAWPLHVASGAMEEYALINGDWDLLALVEQEEEESQKESVEETNDEDTDSLSEKPLVVLNRDILTEEGSSVAEDGSAEVDEVAVVTEDVVTEPFQEEDTMDDSLVAVAYL